MVRVKSHKIDIESIIKYVTISIIIMIVLEAIFNEVIRNFGVMIGLWGLAIIILKIVIDYLT